MTQMSVSSRIAGIVLSGALVATMVTPASAQRIPMGGDFMQPMVDQVAYRRVKRRHGNAGFGAAAAILGAAALGAVIISQSQRRERVYYDQQQYYAPEPVYVDPAPQYVQPQYYGQTHHYRQAPAVDSGSVYAVQPRGGHYQHRPHGYHRQWQQ